MPDGASEVRSERPTFVQLCQDIHRQFTRLAMQAQAEALRQQSPQHGSLIFNRASLGGFGDHVIPFAAPAEELAEYPLRGIHHIPPWNAVSIRDQRLDRDVDGCERRALETRSITTKPTGCVSFNRRDLEPRLLWRSIHGEEPDEGRHSGHRAWLHAVRTLKSAGSSKVSKQGRSCRRARIPR